MMKKKSKTKKKSSKKKQKAESIDEGLEEDEVEINLR